MDQEILKLAMLLSQCGKEEQEGLELLCQAAQEELTKKLKSGVTTADCRSLFVPAAAWLALSQWYLAKGSRESESFTAGDLSVKGGNPREQQSYAAALRQQAYLLLAGQMQDGTFAFRSVPG